MGVRELLRLVMANLLRMKARVVMTAAGVLIGTAAIIVLISLGAGLQRAVISSMASVGELTEMRVMPSQPPAGRVVRVAAGGGPMMVASSASSVGSGEGALTDRVLDEIRAMPGVVAVTPLTYLNGSANLRLGRYETWANIQGIDPLALEALGFQAAEGVVAVGAGQAVVGSRVAQNFYDPRRGMPVEEPPNLNGQNVRLVLIKWAEDGQPVERVMRLRIAGVLAQTGGERDWSIYLSLNDVLSMNAWFTGQRENPSRDGYSQALVKAESPEWVTALEPVLTERGLRVSSPLSMLEGVNRTFAIIQAVLGGIGGIALLVAAFGIANTMVMAIYERTREIGLMKAVGASNADVMSVFLAEAGAIGMLGGLGGVLLGSGLGRAIGMVAWNYLSAQSGGEVAMPGVDSLVYVPGWLPVFAITFSALIGVLSGVYPALRAARLDPIAALRAE